MMDTRVRDELGGGGEKKEKKGTVMMSVLYFLKLDTAIQTAISLKYCLQKRKATPLRVNICISYEGCEGSYVSKGYLEPCFIQR